MPVSTVRNEFKDGVIDMDRAKKIRCPVCKRFICKIDAPMGRIEFRCPQCKTDSRLAIIA